MLRPGGEPRRKPGCSPAILSYIMCQLPSADLQRVLPRPWAVPWAQKAEHHPDGDCQ